MISCSQEIIFCLTTCRVRARTPPHTKTNNIAFSRFKPRPLVKLKETCTILSTPHMGNY